MPSTQKTRKRKPSKSGRNRTHIADHIKVGSELQSGFNNKVGDKITFTSWSNERLPDMLWAAIIRVIKDQNYAICEFRRVINFVDKHPEKEKFSDLSISGISRLSDNLRDEFLSYLLSNKTTASALTALTVFENLPAREAWLKYLPDEAPNVEILMLAIGMTIPHQSPEATDCRWLRVMLFLAGDKIRAPYDFIEPIVGYPYKGDMRKVRPSIRALEASFNSMGEQDITWSKDFWNEAWINSPCIELSDIEPSPPLKLNCTEADVATLRDELVLHWKNTHLTTAVDAKHDCVFGIVFYSLTILEELLGSNVRTGILARLGLRTILESYISLSYLSWKDDMDLWKKWRTYGAGQAKLNAQKFDEFVEPPKFINTEMLESIASEDLWEEFINIQLGSWSGLDLRKISDIAGVKDAYDKYYSWTSTYTHATWGAIREVCFSTCLNPLHRLHRHPKKSDLPDTLLDACQLINETLAILNKCYPTFELRLLEHHD